MTWSDAARKAAAEARKRRGKFGVGSTVSLLHPSDWGLKKVGRYLPTKVIRHNRSGTVTVEVLKGSGATKTGDKISIFPHYFRGGQSNWEHAAKASKTAAKNLRELKKLRRKYR